MGVLQSQLFTEGDPAVVKKLEDCATGNPNEWSTHLRKGHPINSKGEHVRRVQQALKNVRMQRPEFGIPDFEVNGIYDDKFAQAIAVYKSKRDIRNYANKIDDVVGIKTIRSLDSDNKSRAHRPLPPMPIDPSVVPRPVPNCVKDIDCPAGQKFTIQILAGLAGGEVVELSDFYCTIRDTSNGFSSLYRFRSVGLGFSQSPAAPVGLASPTSFGTSATTRVTRFGPMAGLLGATLQPGLSPSVSSSFVFISFSFLSEDGEVRFVNPFRVDTGPVEIPGGNIHGAALTIATACGGERGATRRVLTIDDIPRQR